MQPEINPAKVITLSPQQLAVRDAVKLGSDNLMIEAVAGSGKTFTLLEVLKVLGGNVAFCAFSKNISVEIKAKVEAITHNLMCRPFVGTCHSFGMKSLIKVYGDRMGRNGSEFINANGEKWVNDNKIDILMELVINLRTGEQGVPERLKAFVRKAYRLARQWGAGILPEFKFNRAEAWFRLVDHFELESELFDENEDRSGFDVEELVKTGINWTVYCIKLGLDKVETYIDFEDMIYVPLAKNLFMYTYDVVLVDECQDINPTRRALVKKMMKVGGRAIFVGDPRQAIFGFTGADSESIQNIVSEFGCETLPLTYSFRCPKSVVRFAQQWVSHIESTPDAPEGKVASITDVEFSKMDINVTDVVLCRNNAPLVDLFFSFLGKGIPTHIEGKDIGEELIKLVNRYTKYKTIPALLDKLTDYKEKQIQKWNAAGKEERAERIADAVDAIVAIAGHLSVTAPVADLKNKIITMFRDDDGKRTQTLTLTTIHKAKGREWNRVFWYGRNRFNPSPFARKDWQRVAEDNLCYVAATRSQNELYDVQIPKASKKKVA